MKARAYDTANYINDIEDIVAYLNVILEDGSLEELQEALGTIARSKGMSALSQATGISRQGLYKSLVPDGNPSFETIVKVLDALGLRLQVAALA